jgi:ADP-heptose:LPS heptosyltransferase
LQLLKHIGLDHKDHPFDLILPQELIEQAREKLTARGVDLSVRLIGVCPGSGDSWQDTAGYKQWPRECYLDVLRKIIDEYPSTIILCGSLAEKPICGVISKDLPSDRVLNLCGEVELKEFCALLSLCDLVITNDGGPFHISQALLKKSIVFFGPVDANVYGPYPDDDLPIVFTADVECRPCYRSFRLPECTFDKRCLNEITPDEVFSTIKQVLGP